MQKSPNQQDPDQDQRKNSTVEDPSMTIEFLRARLFSERSVSSTARQRADELAKRVLELEEELKVVSLQRKKAEKAAADVLAILENNGISEFSEEFDSTSDQEVIHNGSKVGHNSVEEEESSVGSKMRRNQTDELSGRSLSWKGGKGSLRPREKKYMDSPTRRRSSSVSTTSSSPRRRIGKSCRQIRRRETRSAAEESQSDHTMLAPKENGVATFSHGFPTNSGNGPETLRDGSERDANIFPDGTVSGDLEHQRPVANGSNYLNAYGSDEDMEGAIAHQAQLIGQYESEEKAQREWEKKFRENNSSTPDSCEPGNHSDVTEEREEPKVDAPPDHVGMMASQDQEDKLKAENICVRKESSESQPNGFQSPPQVNLRRFQDQNFKPSDFEFPVATGNQNQHSSVGNHSVPPPDSYHHQLSHLEGPTGNQSAQIAPSEKESNQYALIPHETPDNVGSVLQALHQAKLSLKQKANNALTPIDSSFRGKAIEFSVGDRRSDVPVGCPGLFRLPSDLHVEASAKSNFPGSNSRLGFTNHYRESGNALTSDDRCTIPFTESSPNVFTGGRNHSIPTNLYTESRSKNPSWEMPETVSRASHRNPFFGPSLGTSLSLSGRYVYNSPNTHGAALVSSSAFGSPAYPFYPDLMPRMPSEDGRRRLFSSTGSGIPPSNRLPFYDDHIRPNNMSSGLYASPAAYPHPDLMPNNPSDAGQRLFSSTSDAGQRLFSSTGTGFPPPNRFSFDNDHFRPNMYR